MVTVIGIKQSNALHAKEFLKLYVSSAHCIWSQTLDAVCAVLFIHIKLIKTRLQTLNFLEGSFIFLFRYSPVLHFSLLKPAYPRYTVEGDIIPAY